MLALLILTGCSSRDLTVNEKNVITSIPERPLDLSIVTVYASQEEAKVQFDLLMAEEMLPKNISIEEIESVVFDFSAIALGNNIYFKKEFYDNDFASNWPYFIQYNLGLFSHEIMHVWQYQNRERTGYTIAKVALEHIKYKDPYYYELIEGKKLLDYRYEQQAKIIEDFFLKHYFNRNDKDYKKLKALIEAEMGPTQLPSFESGKF